MFKYKCLLQEVFVYSLGQGNNLLKIAAVH